MKPRAAVVTLALVAVAGVAIGIWNSQAPGSPDVGAGQGTSAASAAGLGSQNTRPVPRVARPQDAPAAPHGGPAPLFVAPDRPSAAEAEKLGKLVARFQASKRDEDFTDPVAPGHEAAAMRQVSERFEAWGLGPDNAAADVQFFGIDCRQPPCVMALQFNADRGGDFLLRAERWLAEQGKSGKAQTYPHVLDSEHTRLWTWYNPHPEASAERHQFELKALARIQEEVQSLPDYNPSRDLTSP